MIQPKSMRQLELRMNDNHLLISQSSVVPEIHLHHQVYLKDLEEFHHRNRMINKEKIIFYP